MINHPNRSSARKVATPVAAYDHEKDYSAFRHTVQQAFNESEGPLFRTDVEGLYDTYLRCLPSDRQTHTCTACRRFIDHFGGLVRVADDGKLIPAMWRIDVPEFYADAVTILYSKVRGARITRPFLTDSPVLGTPKTGDWEHFAIHNAPVFRSATVTPGQAAAAKLEDYRTVSAALLDFNAPLLNEALRLLIGEHLNRSERFIAPVKWLRELHDRPKGRAGENLLWRAIAMAPPGFCHPRASVTGTLLEDLAAGMQFEDIRKRFNAKVGGEIYQRPQAAPTAGNIAAAEAIIAKMVLAPALERRFARLEECVTAWTPPAPKPVAAQSGVFGHLTPKGAGRDAPSLALPDVTMTWVKFLETVIPTAEEIHFRVPSHGNFSAMLAATNPDAPPILKWDRPDQRNTISSYVYTRGSAAAQWQLTEGSWVKVTGIIPAPNTWGGDPKAYLGEAFVLALEGAVDTRTGQGNALFPEILLGELHGIRATIEAYSRSAPITGVEQASACGYAIPRGEIGIQLRVMSAGKTAGYKIDRWD